MNKALILSRCILILLLFANLPVSGLLPAAYGQSLRVSDSRCLDLIKDAELLIAPPAPDYELALHKLASAKLCDPNLIERSNQLIIKVYNDINGQRIRALTAESNERKARETAQQQYDIARNLLGDRYLAQARIAYSTNDFEKTLTYLDSSLQIKDSPEARLFITEVLNKIPPVEIDKMAFIDALTVGPQSKNCIAYIGSESSIEGTPTLKLLNYSNNTSYETGGQFMALNFSPDGNHLYAVKRSAYKKNSGAYLDTQYEYDVIFVKFSLRLEALDSIVIKNIVVKEKLWPGQKNDSTLYDAREYHQIDFTPNGKYLILSGYATQSIHRGISNAFPHHLRTWINVQNGEIHHDVDPNELSAFHAYKTITLILDDRYIIRDGFAEIYRIDLEQNQILEIGKHSAGVNSLALSPDKKRIACVGDDNRLSILSWQDERWHLASFDLPGNGLGGSVVFTRNDEVAIARTDNLITLFSLKDPAQIEEQRIVLDGSTVWRALPYKDLIGHTGKINSLSVSPNKKWLISSSEDKTVRLWSLYESNNTVLAGNQRGVTTARTDDSASVLYSIGRDGRLLRYDLANSLRFSVCHTPWHPVREEAIPDATWDEGGGLTRGIIRSKLALIRDIQWDNRRNRLISIGYNDSITLWRYQGNMFAERHIPEGEYKSGLEKYYIDYGHRVWAEISGEQKLLLHPFDGSIDSSKVAFGRFSPSGKYFIYEDQANKTLLIWQTNSPEKPLHSYRLINTSNLNISELKFSNDETSFALPCAHNGHAIAIIYIPGAQSFLFKEDITGYSFDLSPDGKALIVAGRTGEVYLYAFLQDKIRVLGRHARYVSTLAFSPDGQWVVSGSRDRSVRVWNVNAADYGYAFFQLLNPVEKVLFHPNGQQFFAASGTGIHSFYTVSDSVRLRFNEIFLARNLLTKRNADNSESAYGYVGGIGLIPEVNRGNRLQHISKILNSKPAITAARRDELVGIIVFNANPDMQERALLELSAHGDQVLRSLPELCQAFKLEDFGHNMILEMAVSELFPYLGPRAESALIQTLANSEDKWVKAGIIKLLSTLFPSSAQTMALLQQLQDDVDFDIRVCAVVMSNGGEHTDQSLKILSQAIYQGHALRNEALEILKKAGAPAIPYLISCLRSRVNTFWSSPNGIARKGLESFGPAAVGPVLDSLGASAGDFSFQTNLVQILGNSGDSSARLLQVFIDIIKTNKSNGEARNLVSAAVYAIAAYKDRAIPAIPDLIELVQISDNFDFRFAASYALEKIGISIIPSIVKILPGADQKTRAYFYRCLKPFGPASREVLPYLKEDIMHCSFFGCNEAFELLGAMGKTAAETLPALYALLENADEYQNYQIVETIGQINESPEASCTAILLAMQKVAASDALVEYKSTGKSMANLRKLNVPEELLIEVNELNDMARRGEYFKGILERKLGFDNFQKYGTLIMEHCRYDTPHYCDESMIFSKGCEAILRFNYTSPKIEETIKILLPKVKQCSNITVELTQTLEKLAALGH